ncbi:MAG: hypothetical protein AB7G93_14140 [Bdellovibrionales bacterium]
MNPVWRLILWIVGQHARMELLREARRRGILAYMRTLQTTRHLLLAVLLGFVFLQFMVFCGVGALVTGFLIWDYDLQAKLEILFWIFLVLFSLPLVLVSVAFSQRLWFRISGAKRMLENLDR